MNTRWILFHLREAQEELTRTIGQFDSTEDISEAEFEVAMAHMYNHLNTAWNSRSMSDERASNCSDEDFYNWRAFPSDISMGR